MGISHATSSSLGEADGASIRGREPQGVPRDFDAMLRDGAVESGGRRPPDARDGRRGRF